MYSVVQRSAPIEGDYEASPPVFTLTPIIKHQAKTEYDEWAVNKPVNQPTYPSFNKSVDYEHVEYESATQWVNRPNLEYHPPDIKPKLEQSYKHNHSKAQYDHNFDPLGETINPFDSEPSKETEQYHKRALSPEFKAPSFRPPVDEKKPLHYHTPPNKRVKRDHQPVSYSGDSQHLDSIDEHVPLYQPSYPTAALAQSYRDSSSPPALESPARPIDHPSSARNATFMAPVPILRVSQIPANPWYKPATVAVPVQSPYFNNSTPSSPPQSHSYITDAPRQPNFGNQACPRPNCSIDPPVQSRPQSSTYSSVPSRQSPLQTLAETYQLPAAVPAWQREFDEAFDGPVGAQNLCVNVQPPPSAEHQSEADSRAWTFQPPPRRDHEYPLVDLIHRHEDQSSNTHPFIASSPPRSDAYVPVSLQSSFQPGASYDNSPLTFAKLSSTPANKSQSAWTSQPPRSAPAARAIEVTSSDIVPSPAKRESKLKLKARPERGQLTMDKFFQPTPPKPKASSNENRPTISSLDDSDLEIENVTLKPKVTPVKPSKSTTKKPKAKLKKPILDASDDEEKELEPPVTKTSSSKSKKKSATVVDTTDFATEASSDYNKYNSQSSFNRHLLDKLTASGHLNLSNQENLQPFWNMCNNYELVVVSAIWIDGSTCFRPATSKQKQLFRSYVRQHRAKATPKECEEREKRKYGAMLAIALVFRFFPHASAQSDQPRPLSAGDFFLPFCDEGRRASASSCADDVSVHSSQSQVYEQQVRTCVTKMLQSETIHKLIFNAKDVLATWLSYSQEFSLGKVASLIDPQIAAWILDPDDTIATNLELLALLKHYLQKESLYPSECQELTTGAMLVIGALGEDLADVVELWFKLASELTANNLLDPFWLQEIPLVPVLSEIQSHGIAFDGVSFSQSLRHLENKMIQLNKRCMELSGREFLISSPQQVAEVLYGHMKFKPVSSGDRGRSGAKNKLHMSTGDPIIQQLLTRETDPDRRALLQSISEYRKLLKIKNSYIEPLQSAAEHVPAFAISQTINQQSARAIYCQWNQCSAGTGRLSTSMPNLQSLPRGTKEISDDVENEGEDGNELDAQILSEINIRSCFHPSRSNKVFLSADFNQMEMRIMAQFSEDPALIDFFRAGGVNDVYRFMASLCFDVDESAVTSQQRSVAKTLSLGIAYGMGPDNMSNKLTLHIQQPYTRAQAKLLIDKWYSRMSGVQRFMAKCRTDARVHGNVRTYAGRWRRLPNIKSQNRQEQAQAERQAMNSVIQGTASDLCKRAMILIQEELSSIEGNQSGAVASLSLQIHDEIVVEVDVSWLPEIASRVKNVMENVFTAASISFPVNLKVGPTLGKLQPYDIPELPVSCPELVFTPLQPGERASDGSYLQTPISNESHFITSPRSDSYQNADAYSAQVAYSANYTVNQSINQPNFHMSHHHPVHPSYTSAYSTAFDKQPSPQQYATNDYPRTGLRPTSFAARMNEHQPY